MRAGREVHPGDTFGRLTVRRQAGKNKHGKTLWECECNCGNITVAIASQLGKHKLSCGCLATEVLIKNSTTHGMAHSREYSAWGSMIQRCTNPNRERFDSYGGRGICIYGPWTESFEEFYKHIGPMPPGRHSVDRIKVDGDYEPGNVRWATDEEQSNNKRDTVYVLVRGKPTPLAIAARQLGISYWVARNMVRNGKLPRCQEAQEQPLEVRDGSSAKNG